MKTDSIILRHWTRFFVVPLLAGLAAVLLFVVFIGGCKEEVPGIVNVCITPIVIRTSPANADTNVSFNKTSAGKGGSRVAAPKIITATFSVPMDPSSITAATFTVQQGTNSISGLVSYSAVDTTALFVAPNGLGPNLTYTCTITTGVRDLAGTSLASNYVWTFTTIALGTPTLVSPANGAVNVATNPTMVWNVVPGADTYRLQISLSPVFAGTVYDDSTRTSTSQPISGLAIGTTYYWRVNSKIAGGTSAYSNAWSFTTIAPPAPPILVAPIDAATSVSTSPILSWNVSSGASTYRLQVSTSPVFASLIFNDSTIAGTSQAMAGLTIGTTYYWRANAKNIAGTSAYSTVRSFTTILTPAAPVLVAPVNAAINQSMTPAMIWNAVPGADTYRLQVSLSPGFVSTVYNDSTIIGTSHLMSALTAGTTYYWRVNAKNVVGTSGYSTVWNFTTVAVPLPPVLVAPVAAAQNQPTSLTMSWLASAGASTYRIQLSTSAVFAGTILDDSTITGTSQPITGLAIGTVYYWRVNAKNASGTSAYSTRSFTTIIGPLQPPILVAPPDVAANISTNPILSWNPSTGATTYRLQVSLGSGFVTTVFDDSTITGLSQQLTGLTVGTTYYWRVNAKNGSGTTGYSIAWRFTVAATIVDLGTAIRYGAIGGNAGITNEGIFTQILGGLGTTAASTLVTGFHDGTAPPSNVFTETPLNIGAVRDTIYTATAPPGSIPGAVAARGLADAQTAFNYLAGLPPGPDPGAGELGGLTLAPGIYTSASGTFAITSVDLTLDAQGDPNARFVFQVPSSLTVGAAGPSGARSIILINGAQPKNVFWVVGTGGSGSATINAAGGGTMVGTIIAYSGVTFSTHDNTIITRLEGRALSLVASVTMVNTIVNVPLP